MRDWTIETPQSGSAGGSMRQVVIHAGDVSIRARLLDTPTADEIWRSLPLHGSARTWGPEIYFHTSVQAEAEPEARDIVSAGEIVFWPQVMQLRSLLVPHRCRVTGNCGLPRRATSGQWPSTTWLHYAPSTLARLYRYRWRPDRGVRQAPICGGPNRSGRRSASSCANSVCGFSVSGTTSRRAEAYRSAVMSDKPISRHRLRPSSQRR